MHKLNDEQLRRMRRRIINYWRAHDDDFGDKLDDVYDKIVIEIRRRKKVGI